MDELSANIIYITGDCFLDPIHKDKCNLVVERVYCNDVIKVGEEPDNMKKGDMFLDGSIFANDDILLNR